MADRATPGSIVTPLSPDALRVSGRGVARFPEGPAMRWFGPNDPMAPTAPPEVAGRILDFPVGYNLAQTPRAYEPITFSTLRALADSWDLLRLLIETRKDQMVKMPWHIIPSTKKYGVNKLKPGKELEAMCDTIETFFQQPDPEYVWADWLRALLEDLLVLDAPTLFVRRTRGGALYALQPLDGATVKRVIDPWGRTPQPPLPAYQQVLKGMPAVDYTTNDLIYRPRNRRTGRIYGYGNVEQVLVTINIALRRQVWQTQYYTEGNIPEALIGVPETWTPDQIAAFQTYWDAILEGNTAQRRHAKFVPGGVAKTYIATKEPELKNMFDEWCARIACFNFSVSPAPFVSNMNRATAESLKEAALEEGLIPFQNWVKGIADFVIRTLFQQPDCEFAWQEDEDVDAATAAEILRQDAQAGLITIDEARGKKGLEPYGGFTSKPLAFTQSGYVPIEEPAPPPAQLQVGPDVKPKEEQANTKSNEEQATKPGEENKKLAKRLVGAALPGRGNAGNKAKTNIRQRYEDALAVAKANVIKALHENLGKASSNKAARIANSADLSSLSDAGNESTNDLSGAAAEGGGNALLALGLNADQLFGVVNNRAADWARERAAQLVTEIDDSTRNQIRQIVADGLDQGLTVDEIAQNIEDATAFSADRAELIAETEVASANSNGALEGLKAAKDEGVNTKKSWLIGDGACDECLENADQGAIDLDDVFLSGDDAPPAHPNCRCALGVDVEE